MAKRIPEQYPMAKSDLYSSDSSDSSFENEIDDLNYHNLRPKTAIKLPFQMENFITIENVPIAQRRTDIIRPHSMTNCKKCNQIRTNPRFRPSTFHCYNELSNVRNVFASNDDELSEDQVSFYKPSYPKNRRRFRHKNQTR